MNISRFNSCLFSFFILLMSLTTSCAEDDSSINPILTWIDGEGSIQATDVFLDFQDMLVYKSATEIHSYNASIKDKIVEGTFEVYNFDREGNPVSDAQGKIESIVFEEDCKTARITGIITTASDPEFLELYAVWTVIDNGAGLNETTDIRYPIDPETAKYHRDAGLSLEWYSFKSYFSAEGKVHLESKGCS
ncbi:MAG TPA: hypothetical protein VLA71_19810 [Algoriphagus sp.]|nr:hypothetical protein [Algoriphagus sp.]